MTDAGCNVPFGDDDAGDDDYVNHDCGDGGYDDHVDDNDDGGDDDHDDDDDDGDNDYDDGDAFACTYVADFLVLSFAFSVDTTDRTYTEIS